MIQKFWLVWNGKQPSTVRHDTYDRAKNECERLARMNPGTKFYVLECLGMCRAIDVKWEIADDGPPPF